jgi:hypothetical protein
MTLQEKSVLDECTDSHPTIVEESMRASNSGPVDSSTIAASSTIVDNDDDKQPIIEPIDITQSVPKEEKNLVKEAGQGGALLGFLFGGPIGCALLGFGSAYAVRKKDSCLGDTARGLAELTISVKEKASTVEEKHHFYKRSKTAIDNVCDDKNEKSIAFKTRAFVVSSWLAATKFAKEKQLVEKGVEGTGKGIEYVGSAISSLRRSKSTTTTTTNNNDDTTTFVPNDEVQETAAVGDLQLNSKESNDEYTKLVDATTN